jgi:hypothetical protein
MFSPNTIYLFLPGQDRPEEFACTEAGLQSALSLASVERIACGLPPVSHVLVIALTPREDV